MLAALVILLVPAQSGGSSCPAAFKLLNGTGISPDTSTSWHQDTNTTSWQSCCTLCTAQPKCTAFTYHLPGHHSGTKCSLWATPGKGHSSEGAVSGTEGVVPPPPPPPPPSPPVTPPPIGPLKPALGFQPNIVFIQTDDQDVELDSLTAMPKLDRLVGSAGASHAHWYVNTPVCCPSRTETLSGRYHHNVRDRAGPEWGISGCGDEAVGHEHKCGCMRVNTSRVFEEHHYGDYLRAAGYHTGYFGKYLNPPAMEPYCHNLGTPIPGWDEMLGMCVTAYYSIPWVNSSGHIERTGTAPDEYSTSIIGNRTVDFITRAAAMKRPFFVSAATRAPHGPSTPAPWYMGKFKDAKNLVTPAFNFTGTGHVDWIQSQKPVSATEANAFDHQFADRWRTLLSVDDLVEAVVEVLAKTNLLDKTFIFYSSDHGYHLGHLRLGPGKSHFYEFDSRVPMLIRGPGVAVGSTPSFIAGNTDLGPSFLDLAGVPTPAKMDGRSIIPMLIPNATATAAAAAAAETRPWRTFFPVEFSGLTGWSGGRLNDCPNNTYRSLRFLDPKSGLNTHFSEYTTVSDYNYDAPNWREWYNLTDDRYQLNNGWAMQDPVKQTELLELLHTTWHCQGISCP